MTTSESFRKEVAEKLDVVVKSLDARASVAFSSCLSAEERKYVHHLAEQFGLRHESKGRGDARFISVSKDPGKAARRNLGARNRTAEEIPKLAWPEAALEALEDPLVKHAAEGNNAQVAASSAPLQAVSPRTIDRLLQSKLPESRLKSAEPLEPPGPPATELLSVRQALPAWQCREQLLEAVQSKQVTLVIGETGCGKSTQVPQFILEACPGANILVTQPRRISALSLAHRVAQERGETVGHVVGYSVHLEHQSSPRTRLHFCTAGVARRRILETPDLPEVTHVVMDELHERDKVTDFLLIAIRDLLARRPELRIILMSATMQHETFQKYFEGCAEVQIHGRVHPVEAIYLEDLAPKLHKLGYVEHLGPGFAAGGYGYGSWDNKGNEKSFKYQVLVGQTHHPDHLCGYGANAWESLEGRRKDEGLFLHDVLQQTKGVLYDLPIIEALLDVLQQEPKEVNGRTNGGILIFLPGWDDIDRLLKRLTKVLPSGQFRILPLHSQIRLEQQKEVFQVPPQGVRKIVLSTNIAETAITIDDIDTVIDCGRAKETSYDAFLRVPTLNTSWISKASASQRRGRAGRTKSWHPSVAQGGTWEAAYHERYYAVAFLASAVRVLAEVADAAEAAEEVADSVASRTGVSENGPGDLKALISALFLNSLIVIGCLIGFTVLRMRFPMMYSHKMNQSKESLTASRSEGVDSSVSTSSQKRHRLRELKTRICDWFSFSIKTSTEDAVDRAGLDAALLREFCTTGALILATVGIPMCIIMTPINSTLGEAARGDDHLSTAEMATIRQDHPWLYYVHAVVVWLVCLAVHFHLDRAQATFLQLRVKWLQNLPAPRSTTVLVENIPSKWRSDEKLREFFGTIFSPEDVAGTHMVKLEDELAKLVLERENLVALKRKAELTFEKTQKVETYRPTWCGPKVDALEYCEENLRGLDDQIISLRKEHDAERTEDPTARTSHCGFVTFKGRRFAEMAQSLQISPNKQEWKVTAAPEVSDLRWNDLRKPRTLKIGSELLGYLCCFGLYIGFMPIVGFVTNLGMAVNMGPFQPIWEGFAPTLGLTIFLCFLPTLFMTIFRTFFVLKSESLAQHKLQFWFFVFQLIFVVLVTTVGKSIITQFRHIAENPNDIIQIMADSLPKATHFYMTYLVLQWSRRAMEMLRYMPLSKFLVFRAIFSQEEAKEMAEPEDQDSFGFGARNVNLAVSVVLGLLFCSMSPLVTLFAMFDLLLARMTYGYLVIYAETRKPDLGGVFGVTQIQFVQLAMALYCMFMVGVLRQKSSSCAWLVAVPSLLIVLYSFWHIPRAYQWNKLPFQEVAFGIDKLEQKDCDDPAGDCYVQPELTAVDQLTALAA